MKSRLNPAQRKTLAKSLMADANRAENRRTYVSNNRVEKAVCRKCKCIIQDFEPGSSYGEFWHPSSSGVKKIDNCPNSGKTFTLKDKEIEPFMRKRERRSNKRLGVRV